MKKSFIIAIFLLIIACNTKNEDQKKLDFVEFDFHFDTESNEMPYNFSSYWDTFPTIVDRTAWEFAKIGNIERMHEIWDTKESIEIGLTQEQRDSFDLYKAMDAIDYILNEAEEHQVVIINEAHQMPQHRIFTTRLLEGLKRRGFKHLGMEGYFNTPQADSIMQANGYPILDSGYHTQEPQFGNLIRTAFDMGFNIFGYESSGHANGKEREINQARNIESYLNRYPNEKILIHCGFDHVYEGDMPNSSMGWGKAMAGRLTEFTGIDPLTISQTIYSEKGNRDYENSYYQITDLERPSVFVNESGELFGQQRKETSLDLPPMGTFRYDIAVFHPRSKKYDRPQWMVYGDRKEVELSFVEENIQCPCLVLAYKKGEKVGKAVPYDIQETDDKKVTLVLDKSDFEIVIWNQKNIALKAEFN